MSTTQDESLHDACAKGHLHKVQEILRQLKASDIINRLNQCIGFLGDTPLHEAASRGRDDILQLLLDRGGNVNAVNNNGDTPLHGAAYWGHDDTLQLLFKYGASMNPVAKEGYTPLHDAARQGYVKCIKVCFSREIVN